MKDGSNHASHYFSSLLGHLAIELAAGHIYGMRERPVFVRMSDGERGALMNAQLPAQGVAGEDILALVRDRVVPRPMGNGHPRFFAWANPSPIGVIADLLAAAINPTCAGGDHAAIYVEHCAVRWLMELTGFPVAGSMGILVSGGSMGSLTCLAAARQCAYAQTGLDVRSEGLAGGPRLVLYVSDQGHSCLRKAAELLGLGAANVHMVPTDASHRMELGALRAAIAADRDRSRAVLCGRERRDRKYRRDRSAARDRRPVRGARLMVPRRRRDRRGGRGGPDIAQARGPLACRLARAGSTQMARRAGGMRRGIGARRTAIARCVQFGAGVPAHRSLARASADCRGTRNTAIQQTRGFVP